MSNQRPGKYERKAMFNDNGAMLRQVITFAKEAEKLLTENGEPCIFLKLSSIFKTLLALNYFVMLLPFLVMQEF